MLEVKKTNTHTHTMKESMHTHAHEHETKKAAQNPYQYCTVHVNVRECFLFFFIKNNVH